MPNPVRPACAPRVVTLALLSAALASPVHAQVSVNGEAARKARAPVIVPKAPRPNDIASDFDYESRLGAVETDNDMHAEPGGVAGEATPDTPNAPASCGSAQILTDLPGGLLALPATASRGAISYFPLYISDKKSWRLTATRPRIACVVSMAPQPDGSIEVLLSTRRTIENARWARLTIPREGGRVSTPAADDPNFILLRRVRRFDDVIDRDLLNYAIAEPSRFCINAGKPAMCPDGPWAAERLIMRAVRLEIEPVNLTAQVRDEHRRGVASLIDTMADPSSRLTAWAIARNELGITRTSGGKGSSPYEIIDAGGASGPSFGWQQIDVGTNTEGCEKPTGSSCVRLAWRKAIAHASGANPDDVALHFSGEHRLFEVRVQEMNYDVYLAFRRAWPAINQGLLQEHALIDGFFNAYATRKSQCLRRLANYGEPFASSPFLRLYVLDLAHVTGEGSQTLKAMTAAALASWRHSASIPDAERAAIEAVLSSELARKAYKNRTLLETRIAGLRAVLVEQADIRDSLPAGAVCPITDANLGLPKTVPALAPSLSGVQKGQSRPAVSRWERSASS